MDLVRQIVRFSIVSATHLLHYRHRHQKIVPDGPHPVCVNIGCGLQVAPGWINVDGSLNAWFANQPSWLLPLSYSLSGAREHYSLIQYRTILSQNRFVCHNLTYGIPLADASADYLYASHFLEHLSKSDGQAFLCEAFRVLRGGGTLRLAVPDLAHAWEMYQRGDKEHMLADYFFTSEQGFTRHRYAYDFELLSKALTSAGFDGVTPATHGEGKTPDLQYLDNREEYTLYVEARKRST